MNSRPSAIEIAFAVFGDDAVVVDRAGGQAADVREAAGGADGRFGVVARRRRRFVHAGAAAGAFFPFEVVVGVFVGAVERHVEAGGGPGDFGRGCGFQVAHVVRGDRFDRAPRGSVEVFGDDPVVVRRLADEPGQFARDRRLVGDIGSRGFAGRMGRAERFGIWFGAEFEEAFGHRAAARQGDRSRHFGIADRFAGRHVRDHHSFPFLHLRAGSEEDRVGRVVDRDPAGEVAAERLDFGAGFGVVGMDRAPAGGIQPVFDRVDRDLGVAGRAEDFVRGHRVAACRRVAIDAVAEFGAVVGDVEVVVGAVDFHVAGRSLAGGRDRVDRRPAARVELFDARPAVVADPDVTGAVDRDAALLTAFGREGRQRGPGRVEADEGIRRPGCSRGCSPWRRRCCRRRCPGPRRHWRLRTGTARRGR